MRDVGGIGGSSRPRRLARARLFVKPIISDGVAKKVSGHLPEEFQAAEHILAVRHPMDFPDVSAIERGERISKIRLAFAPVSVFAYCSLGR
jgi:hypothetical protein